MERCEWGGRRYGGGYGGYGGYYDGGLGLLGLGLGLGLGYDGGYCSYYDGNCYAYGW